MNICKSRIAVLYSATPVQSNPLQSELNLPDLTLHWSIHVRNVLTNITRSCICITYNSHESHCNNNICNIWNEINKWNQNLRNYLLDPTISIILQFFRPEEYLLKFLLSKICVIPTYNVILSKFHGFFFFIFPVSFWKIRLLKKFIFISRCFMIVVPTLAF